MRHGDLESAGLVQVVDSFQTRQCALKDGSVLDALDCDEMDVLGEGADKSKSIDKKHVLKTQSDIFVCLQELERKGAQLAGWDTLRRGACRLATESANVWATDLLD